MCTLHCPSEFNPPAYLDVFLPPVHCINLMKSRDVPVRVSIALRPQGTAHAHSRFCDGLGGFSIEPLSVQNMADNGEAISEDIDLVELVSGLFMLGVEDPEDLSSIEDFKPGSIILTLKLFRNARKYVEEPLELEKLCKKLHDLPGNPIIGSFLASVIFNCRFALYFALIYTSYPLENKM